MKRNANTAIINNEKTLINYKYNGCDCELIVDGVLCTEEALRLINGIDEYEHEENQIDEDETGDFYYSENTYD